MHVVEIVLLVTAYSLLIVTLFLQIICYKRHLEFIETIGLTFSLLLLIIAITLSALSVVDESSPFLLLAMVLVGVMTPLNVFKEREHQVRPFWQHLIVGVSIGLLLAIVGALFTGHSVYLEYAVAAFLGLSVLSSMALIRVTKPVPLLAYRESVDRLFSIAFMILVPFSLVANFILVEDGILLKLGLTIPVIFILLAGNKFWGDIHRLALLGGPSVVSSQQFRNYGLTQREREVAALLVQGKTYREIGEVLFISLPTVKSHTSNIYKKCQVKGRPALTALLLESTHPLV